MIYYSPEHLLVGVIARKLETNCQDLVSEGDRSRVHIVAEFDFSGSPVKPDATANKVIVRPDQQIGPNRGCFDMTSAIGYGPRTWAYFTEVYIQIFPVRTTKDRDEVRRMMATVSGRVIEALHELQKDPGTDTTEDGHWCILMAMSPFIQGAGMAIKDAGATKTIKGEQRFIVGFILQYLGG